jgi:glycosidase
VSHPATAQTRADVLWWRTAVIYQIYIRSFADGDGDGIGDLAGIRSRLPYLRDLGADAIWITPFYPSPMADGGYDVADYRDIEPLFGTLADADAMIAEAPRLGLRVIIDIVPNHSSDQHRWFQAALAAGPGSPERQRYVFRPGRGSTASWRRPTGSRPSAGRPGPGCPTASGTSTCSPRSSPTSTGRTRRSSRSSRTSCGSGWTAASTGSGSTSPTR